jgi:hypothetical protein
MPSRIQSLYRHTSHLHHIVQAIVQVSIIYRHILRVQGKLQKRSTMPLNPLAGILKDAKNLGFSLDGMLLNFFAIDPSWP